MRSHSGDKEKPLPFFTLMMLRNASWNTESGSFGAKLIRIDNLGGISAVAKRRLHFLYLVKNFARIALSSEERLLVEVLRHRCISGFLIKKIKADIRGNTVSFVHHLFDLEILRLLT